MNQHGMTTRSKTKNMEQIETNQTSRCKNGNIEMENIDEIDEHGNLKDFIVYDNDDNDDNDKIAFKELHNLLYGNKYRKKSKIKNKKNKKDNPMGNIFMNYLIMKATEKANEQFKNKRKKNKRKKVQIEELDEESDDISYEGFTEESAGSAGSVEESTGSDEESAGYAEESTGSAEESAGSDEESDGSAGSAEESAEPIDNTSNTKMRYTIRIGDKLLTEKLTEEYGEGSEESSDDEFSFEYDEYDEELEEALDNHASLNSEEHTMEYFHRQDIEKKKELIQMTKDIYNLNDSEVPLRFKIINSHMDLKTKAVAIENIDKLSEMDVATGEHSKMDHWINGLIKIPFGKYQGLPVTPKSTIEEKRSFIRNTYQTLDKAIYGHNDAKTHILQVIGKWIKNPDSGGNVLAIQGPMGNGKTTLVKEGISKVLNRPFAFISLGGASDSAYFDGHCYTYEGSHWGRIVQILQDSKCMNPIIYFDELDKISDTQKGDEITHMLTHLTDSSQNSLFQDNYYPGINLDLSKALFIFSYNDESMVNKILRDRMYVIHTKGFKTDEKIKIIREYLLPDIYNTFAFKEDEITFSDEILKEIIEKYTGSEEGVRNLKRCLESIVSKVNIYILTDNDNSLSFNLKDFKLPFDVRSEHLSELLNKGKTDKPPEHMYM